MSAKTPRAPPSPSPAVDNITHLQADIDGFLRRVNSVVPCLYRDGSAPGLCLGCLKVCRRKKNMQWRRRSRPCAIWTCATVYIFFLTLALLFHLALHQFKRLICHFHWFISKMCVFSLTAAFTKMITINGQEYHLQLVDTAGQVWCSAFSFPLASWVLYWFLSKNVLV